MSNGNRKNKQNHLYYVCLLLHIIGLKSEAQCSQIGKFSLHLQNEIIVVIQSCTNASSHLVMLQGVIQLSGLTKNWRTRTQF